MRNFLFVFQELRVPTVVMVENDKMVGVKFSRTEVTADGQVRTVPDTSEEKFAPRSRSARSAVSLSPFPACRKRVRSLSVSRRSVKSWSAFFRMGTQAVLAASWQRPARGWQRATSRTLTLESGTGDWHDRRGKAYLGLNDAFGSRTGRSGAQQNVELPKRSENWMLIWDRRGDLSAAIRIHANPSRRFARASRQWATRATIAPGSRK